MGSSRSAPNELRSWKEPFGIEELGRTANEHHNDPILRLDMLMQIMMMARLCERKHDRFCMFLRFD